jgi:hypothetical protein
MLAAYACLAAAAATKVMADNRNLIDPDLLASHGPASQADWLGACPSLAWHLRRKYSTFFTGSSFGGIRTGISGLRGAGSSAKGAAISRCK